MIRIPVTIVVFVGGLLACIASVAAAPQENTVQKPCESSGEKVLLAFDAGASTIAVSASDPGRVIVTITDADRETAVFGDRPSRRVGVVDTQAVIDFLGNAAKGDPANLAIVGRLKGGDKDTLILEVLAASGGANVGEVVLEGRVLEDLGAATEASGRMTEGRRYESVDIFVDDVVATCCPGDQGCDISFDPSCVS